MDKKEKGVQKNDVFTKLRSGANKFSPQQRSICSYILENSKQVVFYTVEELAIASETSTATIVRTMKNLGYENYREFLDELRPDMTVSQKEVWWSLRQLWYDEKTGAYNEPTLSWVFRDNIDGIENSLTKELFESFDRSLELMAKAEKIGIVGIRSSSYAAGFLFHMLNQLFSNVYLLGASCTDMIYDDMLNFGPRDVIIAVSLGGPHYVVTTHKAIEFAKECEIPTILITNYIGNQGIDLATVTLTHKSATNHYSIASTISLVEAMVTELAIRKEEVAQEKIVRLEKVMIEKGVSML